MRSSFRFYVVADRGWTNVEVCGVHLYDDAKDIARWYFRKNAPKSVRVENSSGSLRFLVDAEGETEVGR